MAAGRGAPLPNPRRLVFAMRNGRWPWPRPLWEPKGGPKCIPRNTDPGTKVCKIAPLAKEVGVLCCTLSSMLGNARGIYSWLKGLKRSMLKNPISHFLIQLFSNGYDLKDFFLCNVINTYRAVWSRHGVSTPFMPGARPA